MLHVCLGHLPNLSWKPTLHLFIFSFWLFPFISVSVNLSFSLSVCLSPPSLLHPKIQNSILGR